MPQTHVVKLRQNNWFDQIVHISLYRPLQKGQIENEKCQKYFEINSQEGSLQKHVHIDPDLPVFEFVTLVHAASLLDLDPLRSPSTLGGISSSC